MNYEIPLNRIRIVEFKATTQCLMALEGLNFDLNFTF